MSIAQKLRNGALENSFSHKIKQGFVYDQMKVENQKLEKKDVNRDFHIASSPISQSSFF